MVLSRNDKRKRKEGDLVDLMEPLSESPKRTKVHAQRKFAQGATTVFSPAHTPVKDKEKIKPTVMTELITHRRPNTEDFLTYLCFRGTSILPPSLNFFNVGAKKEKHEAKQVRTTAQDKSLSLSSTSVDTLKPDSNQKTVVKAKTLIAEKKKVSNGMQKNMTKYKNATSTIQALKKKYQEQRLAKQRIKNKFKSPCVMRTRSCTERAIIKTGTKLAPRKFLPRIETKRHGLRSSVLSQKTKKPSPKPKPVPPKPKKKLIVKHKSSESSNSDESSPDEDNEDERDEDDDEDDNEVLPLEKSTAQVKRNIQKNVQKRICTRSKSEMRRITRSHTGTISPKNLSRRPTRKTKEAAAVYMEILGRKLVSPDLENDDISVDSFPELPNARKIAQTENEIKAKVKQTSVKTLGKSSKVCTKTDVTSNVTNKKSDKNKTTSKVIFKSKRLIRVQRYCEIDTDEESASSVETNTRPITRRSLGKVNKPAARSLRSSSRNIGSVSDVQSNTSSVKQVSQSNQNSSKTNKEKFVIKRKREQNVSKSVLEKAKVDNGTKQKETKADENEVTESDEETLGMLLNKMKKKKETITETKTISIVNTEIVKDQKMESETSAAKAELSKVSDDEESFRGFTKKAISKVLNSCQTHASANLLVAEDPGKVNDIKEIDHQESASIACSTTMDIIEEKLSVVETTPIKKVTEEEFVESQTTTVETRNVPEQEDVATKVEKKCSHESEVPSSTVVDMSLSNLHVRKERVNMSAEQIEKWLNESSLAKEESKLEMENMPTFRYDTGISEKVVKADVSHLSISTKIQHLVRPVNVTLSKIVEKSSRDRRANIQCKSNLTLLASNMQAAQFKQRTLIPVKNKMIIEAKDALPPQSVAKSSKESLHGEDSDTVSKSDHNSVDGSTEKKSPTERKSIFQPRKPFLPKVKERKVTTNANAFSPENESSVYAFESDTELPISTPFRRKVRETASSSKSATPTVVNEMENVVVEETVKTTAEDFQKPSCVSESTSDNGTQDSKNTAGTTLTANKFELPKNFVNLANVQVLPLDKLTTTWSNVNCSASIAVQVNLDHQAQEQGQLEADDSNQQKCTEISTQTEGNNENDDDNDGQLFYIPLQAVTRNGPNLVQGQQLIQGVAVKLGTEGPNGPNQRVLLRAKLVTKPPLSVARCPPIGTVQPTTRTPPNSTTVYTESPIPTTSTSTSSPAAPVASTTVTPAVTSTMSPAVTSTTPSGTVTVATATTATTSTITQPPNVESSSTVAATNEITTQTSQNVSIKHPKSAGAADRVSRSPKASRERKTSVDSTKNGKRAPSKSKLKSAEFCSPSNSTTFPGTKSMGNEARLVEAPTFHPTEKDFQDPLEYIDKIRPIAEKFGICRVVPPPNFKPECKVSDDMRFTAYNQYVHRMLHRWGPNVKEMMAIKKYLATQSITLTHPPWIGGMEVDLPHLYQTVQSLGGLKEVIEKKKWQKVADGMKIPKSAQDRVTKLDDIYCKYLLPYDTLSPEERGKLFNEVETEWAKRESKALERQNSSINENDDDESEDSSDEIEECIVKGRNMPLNAFYRIARNTQRMWFGENQRSGNEAEGASADEVEAAFWKHVAERKRHVCVHAASIDSSGRGFGFSVAKNSPFARHPWNLKVLTNNVGSVLRALGPLMGVTIPTLHVGMLFSACCWYRDPHGLPWIEYLHTGAKKIWYGIPDEHNNNFREALSKMVPRYCKNKTIWLPSDTAMVPPELLVSNGVPLCQTVQEPGQFIIVFPKAFTSSICTGYVVSESVYFAQSSWLETGEQVYKDIQESCEPSIFSFEKLLFNIINDTRSHVDVLKQILPTVSRVRDREIELRQQLESIGLTTTERLPLPDSGKRRKGKKVKEDDGDFECEICRANLFVSLVNNSQDDSVYCLPHALQFVAKKKQHLKHCTLMYTYSEDELDDLIHKLEDRIEAKSKKSNQIKQAK